jgi:hypothetical protein
MEDRLWTTKDVCRYLGITRRTLDQWRAEEVGPPALQLDATLRYVPEHVRAWTFTFTESTDYWDRLKHFEPALDPTWEAKLSLTGARS